MSETNDQPAAAGVGETPLAPTDDIDTEAFDRAEAPETTDDADPAAGEDTGAADDPDKPTEDDGFEVELDDGTKHKVPTALKEAFLRHRDYTQKTQDVAAKAREIAERAQALETEKVQQAESFKAFQADHIKVGLLEQNHAALSKEAETYRNVDWAALKERDPDAYEAHRDRQRTVRDSLIDLDEALSGAKTELSAKEAKRLEDAKAAETADLTKRQEETGRVLAAEIPGWNREKAGEVAAVMVSDFGVSPEEIAEATDPRIWKMVHALLEARGQIAKLSKAQQQLRTATTNERTQTTTPAASGKGTAGASARDPSTPRGDALATAEWMRRRNAQDAAKRQRA